MTTLPDNTISLAKVIKKIATLRPMEEAQIYENVLEALRRGYNKEINQQNELIIEESRSEGLLTLFEELTVVKTVADPFLEISLVAAKKINKIAKIGEKIRSPVAISRYSRFAIQQVSQTMKHFINVAESNKIYDDFIDKKGTILSGTIENIDYRYYSVDIGGIFAFVPREEQIPFKKIRHGDRVKILVTEVFHNHTFGQVKGSRSSNEFLEELFKLEIPEVSNGIIKIEQIVREPGVRAKVAVSCEDSTIDPIGTCIGRGGSRILAISNELKGEKIDIFFWDKNPETFLINACTPSKIVSYQFIDAEQKKVRLLVVDDQYPIAIGKFGSAVRLLAKITGYEVDLKSLERSADQFDKIELNGNLTKSDLEKLEMAPEILAKCFDPEPA